MLYRDEVAALKPLLGRSRQQDWRVAVSTNHQAANNLSATILSQMNEELLRLVESPGVFIRH